MGAITSSRLWDVQDALKAELLADADIAANEITVDLGSPGDLNDDHVWISGGADVDDRHELSGGYEPSGETFTIELFGIVTLGDDFEGVRTRLLVVAAAIERAIVSDAVTALVDMPRIRQWRVRDGVDETRRQYSLLVELECTDQLA